jgi:hypothetical protein
VERLVTTVTPYLSGFCCTIMKIFVFFLASGSFIILIACPGFEDEKRRNR